MKYKIHVAIVLALIGGLLLSLAFINPYSGNTTLSELVLQLSGSRGEFPLGTSLPELVSLVMRMIPGYVFEIYFGTVLYRHFCTASIYVFSRYPKRLKWYFNELLTTGGIAFLYQSLLLVTVIFIATLRYQLQIDTAGIILLVYHLLLHMLWLYFITLCVNLLAIRLGSSTSFLIVVGIQIICITLLGNVDRMEKYLNNSTVQELLLKFNPIAHLILGWHHSGIKLITQVLNPPYPWLDLDHSLITIFTLCCITVFLGAVIVKKHNFIIANSETGVL